MDLPGQWAGVAVGMIPGIMAVTIRIHMVIGDTRTDVTVVTMTDTMVDTMVEVTTTGDIPVRVTNATITADVQQLMHTVHAAADTKAEAVMLLPDHLTATATQTTTADVAVDTQLFLQPAVVPIHTTQPEQDLVVVANVTANRHRTKITFVQQADKQGKTPTVADPALIIVEVVAHAQIAKVATRPLQVAEQITQPVLLIIRTPEVPATQAVDHQATAQGVTNHAVHHTALRHQTQVAEAIAVDVHLHPAAAVDLHPVAVAVEVVPHPVVVAEDNILNLVTSYPNCNS